MIEFFIDTITFFQDFFVFCFLVFTFVIFGILALIPAILGALLFFGTIGAIIWAVYEVMKHNEFNETNLKQ